MCVRWEIWNIHVLPSNHMLVEISNRYHRQFLWILRVKPLDEKIADDRYNLVKIFTSTVFFVKLNIFLICFIIVLTKRKCFDFSNLTLFHKREIYFDWISHFQSNQDKDQPLKCPGQTCVDCKNINKYSLELHNKKMTYIWRHWEAGDSLSRLTASARHEEKQVR